MKTYLCLLATALCGVAVAQNPPPATAPGQEPSRSQAQPVQPDINRRQTPPPTDPSTPASERVTQGLGNILTEWRLEDLPAAVQKTVREQAAGQKIADIDREDRTGNTVWEVEFERQGRNIEIHVGNDGTLIPEDNTGPTGRTRTPTPPVGAPGTAQTGREPLNLGLGTQWEDLPKAVQDKAMHHGGKAKVADIDRETWNGQLAYEVEFRRQGRNLEIHFGVDGTVLNSNDPNAAPGRGAAPAGQEGREKSPTQPPPTQIQPEPIPDPIPNPDPGLNPPPK